jgi:hypothetical protein
VRPGDEHDGSHEAQPCEAGSRAGGLGEDRPEDYHEHERREQDKAPPAHPGRARSEQGEDRGRQGEPGRAVDHVDRREGRPPGRPQVEDEVARPDSQHDAPADALRRCSSFSCDHHRQSEHHPRDDQG